MKSDFEKGMMFLSNKGSRIELVLEVESNRYTFLGIGTNPEHDVEVAISFYPIKSMKGILEFYTQLDYKKEKQDEKG